MRMRDWALGMAGVLALTGPALAEAKYTWKLTTFVPEGTSTYKDYVQTFIDYVGEVTDGEVEIQGFGAGVIAGAFEGWKAVQQGTADIMLAYPAFLSNQDPANALFGGMPAGLPLEAKMHWIYQGGGEALWVEFRRETMGLHPLITGFGPTEILLHSHRPVRTAADMQGLKIRTAGAWADIVQEFGASPVVTPPAEIFTALERKVIDATEFLTPSGNVKLGYHKVAKYIVTPGIHVPSWVYEAVFNVKTWDALEPKLQEKLRLAARLAAMESNLRTGAADLAAMAELKAGSNEWVELDPGFVKEIAAASRRWADRKAGEQTAAGNPWMAKFVDSYYGFMDDWAANADYRMTSARY